MIFLQVERKSSEAQNKEERLLFLEAEVKLLSTLWTAESVDCSLVIVLAANWVCKHNFF